MTVYPQNFDTDLEIPRIEDNLTEIGGNSINALRDAVFAVQQTIGLNVQGTVGDLVSRLAVSINDDGTIKSSALPGLVTLPIYGNMIANNTIGEPKLALDYPTATLYADIQSLISNLNSYFSAFALLDAQFMEHILGIPYDGYLNRHVASHIDINDGFSNGSGQHFVGIDFRDIKYYNVGLVNTSGFIRNAPTVMDALIQINSDFVLHALSLDGYHTAAFIDVDTSLFNFIPKAANTAQAAFNFIDAAGALSFEEHRAEQHSTGIPRNHNVTMLNSDGYNTYFGPFPCQTQYLIDGTSTVIFLSPSDNSYDWAFSQIDAGDTIRINYGGFEASFPIENVIYTPATTFQVVLDGYNIVATNTASALFEKAHFDNNSFGILAAGVSNHNYPFNPLHPADTGYPSAGTDTPLQYVPGSVIILTPDCATATGIDLSLNDLDSTHYMLYVGFYPDGNPASSLSIIPPLGMKGIDVTGNKGITPGTYTLQGIINNVNNQFRAGGYNFRMLAFEYKGQFGLGITDTIDNPGFSIIYGAGPGIQGGYVNNVIDINAGVDGKDPLGFGASKANLASPVYSTSNIVPTKVFVGKKSNKYNVNGQFLDYLSPGYGTKNNYYYDAQFVEAYNFGGTIRQRGYFRIYQNLSTADIVPGDTITIHPYSIVDYGANFKYYGRFIVENVQTFCDGYIEIWTVDCCAWTGASVTSLSVPDRNTPSSWIPVKLYFSSDSVSSGKDGNAKNYYEINVKRDGNTFLHRRASLPLSGSSLNTTLGTDYSYLTNASIINYGWHIVNISPKLRGFIPTGSSSNQTSIRFVVQNYLASDCSYEGYISQPDGASLLTNVGQTIRVKVGETGRYYDNTGIDYIEIKFDNDPTNPLNPLAISTQLFVDIKIFETIRTNEQYLCLGSCEFLANGLGISGRFEQSAWNVRDFRQFGTVSETVLTTSAISFIESGDRWLHQNGVVNGFDYTGLSTSTYLVFNGGVAVIDGAVVNVNNFKVYPLNIWRASPLVNPDSVSFAICIKKDGTYECVPISTTVVAPGLVAYTSSSGITTTIRVYSLAQLIEEQKDLLPIYKLIVSTGTNAAFSFAAPVDLRKFVANNEAKDALVLYNTTNISGTTLPMGNFRTWDAACSYITETASLQNTLIVKGTTSILSPVNFGSTPVTVIGEPGNIVYCYVRVGINFVLNSNNTIKNINFIRGFGDPITNPATGYIQSCATIGFSLNNNSIVQAQRSNITIDGCSFSTIANYRKPGYAHILFEKFTDNAILQNVSIKNNTFCETTTQLDIAITNINGLDASSGSISAMQGFTIIDVTIDHNKGNNNSWVIIGSDNYWGGGTKSRGLNAYGLRITNNTFDYVWHNLSRTVFDTYNGSTFAKTNSGLPALYHEVLVENNTFIGFINRAFDGTLLGVDITVGSYVYKYCGVANPSMLISSNRMTSLSVSSNGDVSTANPIIANSAGPIDINHNIITSSIYEPTKFNPSITEDATSSPNNYTFYGIAVLGNVAKVEIKKNLVNINNNFISNDLSDYYTAVIGEKYNYIWSIVCYVPCNINNNNIQQCIASTGNGITIVHNLTPIDGGIGPNTVNSNITNNVISRGDNNIINSYISVFGGQQLNRVIITDNIFDYPVVNAGLDYGVIKYSDASNAYKITMQRNINQQFIVDGFQHMFVSDNSLTTNKTMWLRRGDPTAITSTFNAGFSLDAIGLSTNSGEFSTQLFFLDVPIIDGAIPMTVSFQVGLTDVRGLNPNYSIRAYSQISETSRTFNLMNGSNVYLPSEYFVSPAFGVRNILSPTIFTISLGYTLLSRYAALNSANKSMSIIIILCETTGNQELTINNVSDNYDTGFIENINMVYQY